MRESSSSSILIVVQIKTICVYIFQLRSSFYEIGSYLYLILLLYIICNRHPVWPSKLTPLNKENMHHLLLNYLEVFWSLNPQLNFHTVTWSTHGLSLGFHGTLRVKVDSIELIATSSLSLSMEKYILFCYNFSSFRVQKLRKSEEKVIMEWVLVMCIAKNIFLPIST